MFDDIEYIETTDSEDSEFMYSSESGEEDEYSDDWFDNDEYEELFEDSSFDQNEQNTDDGKHYVFINCESDSDIEHAGENQFNEEKQFFEKNEECQFIEINEDNHFTEGEEDNHLFEENEPERKYNFNFLTSLLNIYRHYDFYENWHITNDECDGFDDDDNQTIIDFYDWKERVELFNADQLLADIRARAADRKPKDEGYYITKSNLRAQITRDFIRNFLERPKNVDNIDAFINDYFNKNNDLITMHENVRKYKEITNMKLDTAVYSIKTLKNKIRTFMNLTKEEQEQFLTSTSDNKPWGGTRASLKKISDESLECLIALVLDFPTMSAKAYANYLNSSFGPNSDDRNHVHERTIQRYLKNLDFTVKNVSFAPPNRNSIGLRIYRVAWCRLIENIIQKDNVLLGFIDEAAVT